MSRDGKAFIRMLTAIALLAPSSLAAENAQESKQGSLANVPELKASHIAITKPDEIRWTGKEGEQKALLFGNPEQAGPYAMLIRWGPGKFSKPHFHSKDRMVYIISGKWWMSSSNEFDPTKTVPLDAGSFVVQKADTVHWDGALDEPCELLLIGEGPVSTTWLGSGRH